MTVTASLADKDALSSHNRHKTCTLSCTSMLHGCTDAAMEYFCTEGV